MPDRYARRVSGADDSERFDAVGGTRFSDVAWYAEIGSTNTELLARARAGAPEGLVMIADLQTAGRGRRGRRWTAPAGTSLMMSVLLRPPHASLPPSRASLVTLAVALAAADACDRTTGVRPSLKWPNDLVVSRVHDPDRPDRPDQPDRKVAGILAESIVSDGRLEALVVGMGLNTGWPKVPAELAAVATSLNLESGVPVDRTLLARRVLEGFERRYAGLCSGDGGNGAALLDEARRCSATLGRRVRIEFDAAAPRVPSAADAPRRADTNALSGIATDLDADGRLLVTDPGGVTHTVAVGDVVHLRATAD